MISVWRLALVGGLLAVAVKSDSVKATTDQRKFPKGFKFAVSTAAYQTEGAWNQTGKGWSVWDVATHSNPDLIRNRQNGDIACDSFHKYKEDIENARLLGVDVFRLSISWPRIMPKGLSDEINQAGVDYYHKVIDELLANGIEPMITMYHWDMPETIQNMGGFLYLGFDKIFGNYANFLFETYGYKVKWWTTFNEPLSILWGYNGDGYPPFIDSPGVGEYIAGHNLIKAHARAYRIYKDNYAYQNGSISLNIDDSFCLPKTNSVEDEAAVERCFAFGIGFFMNPIFSKKGDYSDIVKTQVAKLSKEQGVPNRLPVFTVDEIKYIQGTYDYLALNSYSSYFVSNGRDPSADIPSMYEDSEITKANVPNTTVSPSGTHTVPQGIRPALKWIKENYDNPPIFFTEFGYGDYGNLEDDGRINYYELYFEEMKKSVLDDGVNLIGATAWSIMDNFEWLSGYTVKFGLIRVDFDDPERTRTWKKSAHWYKNFIKFNKDQ